MKCKINGAVQFTIEDSEGEDSHRKSVRYDHPSRQPSRRQSSVDPMKTRILEDTLRHVQDKALGEIFLLSQFIENLFHLGRCPEDRSHHPGNGLSRRMQCPG